MDIGIKSSGLFSDYRPPVCNGKIIPKKTIRCVAFVLVLSAVRVAAALDVGFARVDVTPPMGTPISGYFGYRPAVGVLDPLEATCVAFSDGCSTALVYTVDNLHISDDIIARAWTAVGKATGVGRDGVYIASTHTHTGAATERAYYLIGADPETEKAALATLSQANDLLVSRIADAGRFAIADLAPAELSIGRGACKGISFIRLFRMKDGSVSTNPGIGNPQIDRPVGEPDETVQLVRIARRGRKEIAIVNFQCHPDVIGGRSISADWPGFVRRTIERAMDGEVLCAFFNGAQGDTNHINVNPEPGRRARTGYFHSRRMGRAVAGAALMAWDDCVPVKAGKVESRVRFVKVKANKDDPSLLPEARRIKAAHLAGRKDEIPYKGMAYTTVVAEAIRRVAMADAPDYFELPVSTVAIGGALAFAGFPGEPFTVLGTDLKERSPFAMTVPTCVTNGSWQYFATEEVYGFGGYEARSAKLVSGVGELLRDALLEDLNAEFAKTR